MRFLAFLVAFSFSLSAVAQVQAPGCPLVQERLVSLRVASAKLAQRLALPADCQGEADRLKVVGDEVNNIITKIEDSENQDSTTAEDLNGTEKKELSVKEKKDMAVALVAQFDSINRTFNSRCGAQLTSFLDYFEAFVDTVNGMVPFLALYGDEESAPWVLGTAITGASLKILISVFRGKNVDMSKPEQRATFISNSCSFYTLKQVSTALEKSDLEGEFLLKRDLERSKLRLADLENKQKLIPSDTALRDYLRAQQDQEYLAQITPLFSTEPAIACLMSYEMLSDYRANPIDSRVSQILRSYEAHVLGQSTQSRYRIKLFREHTSQQIQNLSLDTSTANIVCPEGVRNFQNQINRLNDEVLIFSKKLALTDAEAATYLGWAEEIEREKQNIVITEARMKFLKSLTGDGYNIEVSEILDNAKASEKALFDDTRLFDKGLVHSWINFKLKQGDVRLKEGRQRINEARKEISNISNTQACALIAKAHSAWYASEKHYEAANDYCSSFSHVIDGVVYKKVHSICSTHRASAKNKLSALVEEYEPIKAQLRNWSQEKGCPESRLLNTDDLKGDF